MTSLVEFLDPDGDGVHRGFRDTLDATTGARRTDIVDADNDQLSEYRIVDRADFGDLCIDDVDRGGVGRCWIPTGNDNCPPPVDSPWVYSYNNPQQRDRDGDGTGDACDSCPTFWDRIGPGISCVTPRSLDRFPYYGGPISRGETVSHACAVFLDPATEDDDVDDDGILDLVCDNCPPSACVVFGDGRSCSNDAQEDSDGDGVGDICDSCPDVPNPDQLNVDRDADGVPDACDNCTPSLECLATTDPVLRAACLAASVNPDQADEDLDGLGDMCDNCVRHVNPAQANCNLEAETEQLRRGVSVEILGDACDPVPCAETRLLTRTSSTDPLGRATTSMDVIEFDARVGTVDPPPAPLASLEGRTTYRFCRCRMAIEDSPARRQACILSEIDYGDDPATGDAGCTLLDLDAHDFIPETLPWRWTTQDVDSPFGAITNPSITATYDAPDGTFRVDRQTRWLLFDEDIPRWLTENIDPSGEIFPALETGASVPGVFWTHTPGEVLQPDFDDPSGPGTEFRERASYYRSGRVMAPITTREPIPCFAPFVPFLGGSRICPVCPFQTPQPWISFGGALGCFDVRIERPFILLGEIPLEPMPGLELAGLQHFANDLGPWVPAAETGRWLNDEGGLRYVKLVDGSAVTRMLNERDGALSDGQIGCTPQTCDPVVALERLEPADECLPPPRREHAAVLSARHAALWVIGGRHPETHADMRDLWRYDLDRSAWRRLPQSPDVTLGRVLAATYSPVNDRVWILDEINETVRRRRGRRRHHRARRRLRRRVRLLRMHPEGGALEVAASWRRYGRDGSFAMSVDPDGGIWIVGSPRRARLHVVLRLVENIEGSIDADGWSLGAGRLSSEHVRASDRGLSLMAERHPRRGPRPRFHDVHELWRLPGGARACF